MIFSVLTLWDHCLAKMSSREKKGFLESTNLSTRLSSGVRVLNVFVENLRNSFNRGGGHQSIDYSTGLGMFERMLNGFLGDTIGRELGVNVPTAGDDGEMGKIVSMVQTQGSNAASGESDDDHDDMSSLIFQVDHDENV